MKKTILATMLTSLFAATAAQAVVVQDENDFRLDLFGDVEVHYKQSTEADSDPVLKIDDADFGVKAAYLVAEDLSAIGVMAFTAESGGEASDANLEEGYVGFSSAKWGTLTFGKQYSIYDDSGIGSDFEMGIDNAATGLQSATQVVKYKVDHGNVYGGIAYILDDDNVTTTDHDAIDGNIGVRFDAVDLTAYYGIEDDAGTKTRALNLEARYTMDNFSLAAAYGNVDTDGAPKADYLGLAGTYQLDKVAFAAGWSVEDAATKTNKYFANVAYAFNGNVTTYIEVAGNDVDDSEFGYVAGMAVKF